MPMKEGIGNHGHGDDFAVGKGGLWPALAQASGLGNDRLIDRIDQNILGREHIYPRLICDIVG